MADIYTLRLEDEVTPAAQKAMTAYSRVAVTAGALAAAVRDGDKAQIAFAQDAHRLASAELSAARAALTAGNAINALTSKTHAAAAAARKAGGDTKGFSYALNGLATAAWQTAFNIGGRLVDGLLDAGKSLADTAVAASSARHSLALLYGGQAEGAAAQEKAIELARKYGIQLDTVLGALKMFKGAGFDLGQSAALVQLSADMRALGSTPAQIESALLAFRKIQSQGYLQGDELNMLSEAGVSVDKIYQSLERTLKKNREQIVKMQGNRQLPAGAVLNAIAESVLTTANSKRFGQAGEAAANETIGGLAGRLSSNLGADVFQAVQRAEPAIVKGFQSILGGALGANGTTFQDALTNALVSVGKGLEGLGPRLPDLVTNLGNIAKNLEKIIELAGRLAGNLLAAPSSKYQSDLPGASLGFDNTQGIGKFLAMRPGALFEAMGDFYRDFFTAGKNMSDGIAAGITAGAPTVGAAAAGVAQGAIEATKDEAKIHSPSRAMADVGNFMPDGLAIGIEEHAYMAQRAASGMAESVVAASSGVLGPSGHASAVGRDAGDSYSSSNANSIGSVHVDVHLGAGATASTVAIDSGPVQQLRDFIRQELVSTLEEQLQGSGA